MAVLINPVSGWWNIHFIDRHFYPPDAKLIKSLPLCSTPQPDILIWPKEKSGNYSVNFRYKLLCLEFTKLLLRAYDIDPKQTPFSGFVCSNGLVDLRRWCPPTPDYWKVNFDGAMFEEFDEAGIGVVIRNSNGEVRDALSEKIKKLPTVEILELLNVK
uniref:Uncharacterized protein n=1 Tax=Quercus lobata TaxID=97700 RepID=A0A7N2MJM2_QUELO